MIDYESPITQIIGDMKTEYENGVMKLVQSYGFDIDKEELVKALRYDREQYEKGYKAAINNIADKLYEIDWYHIHNGELVHGANTEYHEPLYKWSDLKEMLKEFGVEEDD